MKQANNFFDFVTNILFEKDKIDIDVILKYRSSEIGIGFYDNKTSQIKYIWIIKKLL